MELLTIGKNIRKYRLKKEIRQEALAEQLDLSPNYISMMEREEKTAFSADTDSACQCSGCDC